ncbi:alpha/beta hydrolase [Gracilimonas sp.]|uniref:alpha/beta hydrolase n=1 Tax=Gracilimonas sp. TaxID=1974203 RepID=UPI0028718E97|nr:alpha/beta fold hydrolase [Gracilimonas sp.]
MKIQPQFPCNCSLNGKKSFLKSSLIVLVGSYILICSYFYLIQESIIFHPRELPESAEYGYNFDFNERWFEPESNVKIHAIHAFTDPDSAKGLVMYLHGNQGANRTNADTYTLFLDNGYDMIYPDYRSYGKSRGDLDNEDDLVGDIKYVFKEMAAIYGEKNIVLVGYSLGSGVAAQVAEDFNPKKLILWAPFYSLVDVKDSQFPFLPDALVKFPLRTDLAIQQIEEPIHIFYAGEDEVLPLEHSFKLTDYLKGGDSYKVIQGQGHGGIYRHPELQEGLQRLLD